MPSAKPVPVPALSAEEIEELDQENKRLEAWYLSATGASQAAIARVFGVTPSTVGRWLDKVGAERRSRAENIERETERILGMLEAAAADSYAAFRQVRESAPASMAGPSHMKNFLEAVKEMARLRGIEPTTNAGAAGPKVTQVVVRIGGVPPGSTTPAIDVGAEVVE